MSAEEWTLMYRRGLDSRRISMLCGVPVSRINRALRSSREYDGSLDREHGDKVKAGKNVEAFPPTALWMRRLKELTQFEEEHGRMPYSRTSNAEEASLGRWLARQRKAGTMGDLALSKVSALDAVGEWKGSARRQQDCARWTRRLTDLVHFVGENSRLPSYRSAKSELERVLGTWLHSQRQLAYQGSMSRDMREMLDAAVPTWNTWNIPKEGT